jgi:hypothetical protein
MIPDEQLKKYYETARFVLPFDAGHRFFQFEHGEGRRYMPVVKKTIRTPEDLRKLALKYLPQAIYVSRGRWLNAKRVLPDRKKKTHANPFLGADVVMDLDFKDFSSQPACALARDLLLVMMRHVLGNELGIVVNHSGRGYHLWFFDAFPKYYQGKLAADGREREKQFRNWLCSKVSFLKKAERKFSMSVFVNPFQVFRVVGSINPKVGKIVQTIPALTSWPSKASSPASEIAQGAATMSASVMRKQRELNTAIHIPVSSQMISASHVQKSLGGEVSRTAQNCTAVALVRASAPSRSVSISVKSVLSPSMSLNLMSLREGYVSFSQSINTAYLKGGN